jgi:hypothetical protein
MYAYAWRSGKIEFGRRVPKGALEIAHSPGRKFRNIIEVNARHAYDNKTLLVPGIPEAQNEVEAFAALKRFGELIHWRLAGKTGWPK